MVFGPVAGGGGLLDTRLVERGNTAPGNAIPMDFVPDRPNLGGECDLKVTES